MKIKKTGWCKVKFAGKVHELKFGTCTLLDLIDRHGERVSMSELSSVLSQQLSSLDGIAFLVWSGLKHGALSLGKDFDLNQTQVSYMLDDMEEEGLKIVTETLSTSKFMGVEAGANRGKKSAKKNKH